MMDDFGSRFDFKNEEEKLYKLWEDSGLFNPDNLPASKSSKLKAKSYSILMPPPNANGSLHLGHAVFVALQDIMIRFARMRGKRTLWLPGADHAGFETQVVFDKKLEKEGRNRYEIPREALYKEIWDFTQKNKEAMESQLRMLGASCDWSREAFTLDPKIIETVYETFKKLYDDGLVYRDLRVVNWCPKHQTALSDLEVKYVERTDPLYYIKYGPLTLATVRPETKFGDTALAVNPKDKRYKKYIGKEVEAKGILGSSRFKVVADDAVDPKFGTGVVKVTPAHDPADFETWQRHKDEIPGPKVIIDERGRLTGDVGEFAGLKVAEAREKIAARMKEIGILEKVDPNYVHQIATCYKCGNTLEPLPKPQWFVKTKPLAEPAIKAVTSGKIKIIPRRSEKVYLHWMRNIRDWNISRQIVWGVRIPAWFKAERKELRAKRKEWNLKIYDGAKIFESLKSGVKRFETRAGKPKGADKDWRKFKVGDIVNFALVEEGSERILSHEIITKEIVAIHHFPTIEKLLSQFDVHEVHPHHPEEYRNWWESRPRFKERIRKYGIWAFELKNVGNETQEVYVGEKPPRGEGWMQDPDVFDTWFSSGQWPFAALLARGSKPKIKNQKSKLLHVSKDFETFYPTDVMETGHDILFFWVARMIMLSLYRTNKIPFKTVYLHGLVRDKDRQKMSKSKGNVIDPLGVVSEYGADALRMALVVGNTPGNDIVISEDKIRGYRNFTTKLWNISRFILMNKPAMNDELGGMSKEDRKNLEEFASIKKRVTKHLEKFEFHLAAETLYHYVWHTFADKIIEEAKPRLRSENRKDTAAAYRMLETVLVESLKMLHPFMPFVTEAIYQKFHPKKLLMIEKW